MVVRDGRETTGIPPSELLISGCREIGAVPPLAGEAGLRRGGGGSV